MAVRRRGCLLLAGIAVAGWPGLLVAQEALSAAEIGERITERYGVEILKVEPVDTERGAAYAVKVMVPPGDSNAAFLVDTLLVDARSGEVLSRVRLSEQSGVTEVTPVVPPGVVDHGGTEIRRRSFR